MRGPLAGQALERQHACGPEVRASVHVRLTERLFGRHVIGSAEGRAALGECLRLFGVEHLRHAEIEEADRGWVSFEKDVVGLEISVHDTRRVRCLERLQDRAQQTDGLGGRELAVAIETRTQALADQQLHHEHRRTLMPDDVLNRHDVRMRNCARRSSLSHQTLIGPSVAVLVQELQRPDATGHDIGRRPNLAHAAAAEEPLDAEPTGDNVSRLHASS